MFLRNILFFRYCEGARKYCNAEKRSLLAINFFFISIFHLRDYPLQIERRKQEGERKSRKATVR